MAIDTNYSFSGDTNEINFALQVTTGDDNQGSTTIKDGRITIKAKLWQKGSLEPSWNPKLTREDKTLNRKCSGKVSLLMNYNLCSLKNTENQSGIKFKNISIQKVQ